MIQWLLSNGLQRSSGAEASIFLIWHVRRAFHTGRYTGAFFRKTARDSFGRWSLYDCAGISESIRWIFQGGRLHEAEKQRNRRMPISDGSMPNLFTLCILQVFTARNRLHASLNTPPLMQFWFCDLMRPLADGMQGVHDTVGHYRLPTTHTRC